MNPSFSCHQIKICSDVKNICQGKINMIIFIFDIFKAKAFTLEDIEPSDSIRMVKNDIHFVKGILPADQIIYLAHDNKPLGNDTKLADLNITEGSTLHLQRKGEKSEEKTD